MDKFCEDCIHNSVCHYGACCPSGHCNDKDTLDDLIPQGEWEVFYTQKMKKVFRCNKCKAVSIQGQTNFCYNCGADMRNITETPSSCTTTNPNSVEAYHQSLKGGAE